MDEQRKHIDDLFRDSLNDYHETPPPAVWDALEQRLDRDAGKGGGGTGGRGIYRWLGIGALLVMLTSVGYFFARNSENNHLPIAEAPVVSPTTNQGTNPNNISGAPILTDSLANDLQEDKPVVPENEDLYATSNSNTKNTAATTPRSTADNGEEGNGGRDERNGTRITAGNSRTGNTNAQTRTHSSSSTAQNATGSEEGNANTSTRRNARINQTQTPPAATTTTRNSRNSNNTRTNKGGATPTAPNTAPANPTTTNTTRNNRSIATPPTPQPTAQTPNTSTATAPVNPATTPQQTPTPKPKPKNLSNGIVVNDFLDSEPDTDLLTEEPKAVAPQSPNKSGTAPKHLAITTDEDGNNIYTQDTSISEGPTPGGGSGSGGGKNRRRRQHEDNASTAKIEGGVKAGYEIGTRPTNANKFVMAAYVQYNAAPKVSVLLQPAFKFGNTNLNTTFGTPQSFYNITNSVFDSTSRVGFGDSAQGGIDTIYRTYNYAQTYDSISIVNRLTSKVLWEIELPVMMKYQIARKLTVMGGFSLNLSKMLQVREEQNSYSITQTHQTEYGPVTNNNPTGPFPAAPTPEPFNNIFTHNTPNINTYTPSGPQNSPTTMLRVGYMAGFSYQITNRTMVDLLIQQSLGKPSAIPNQQVRGVYTQPYIRVSVGYRLSK